jgi:hypothetical protein
VGTVKTHENLYSAKARDMRFEYAEKAIGELKASASQEFKTSVSGIRSLITSLKSLENYNEDFMYEPAVYLEKIERYGSKLLSTINSLYKLIYDSSTAEIRRLADNYINAIVDSHAGELFSNYDYYEEYKKANEEKDEMLKGRMLKYLRRDIQVLKNSRKEFYSKHQEYAHAVRDGEDSRQVQTMQAMFIMKELSDFGSIKFEKLEDWLESKKNYIETNTNKHVDEARSILSELKGFRQYMLSLPADDDFSGDMDVELKLHGRELRK